jgi:hypothetical protein
MRALRRLQRETTVKSVYVFISEGVAPLSVAGYQRMVARAGVSARFPFLIYTRMLRHGAGHKLAMMAKTLGPFRPISGIARSYRRSATRP